MIEKGGTMEKQLKKWIKRIQQKADKEAANELVSLYYREIYGYVYKQTLKKELALDLTQEIFMSMLQSIAYYDEQKAAFRTWLYQIATRRLVDYYRSKSYREDQTLELIEIDLKQEEDFTMTLENQLQIEEINQFVNQLDATSQQIFRLKIFGEYTFLDISKMLKLPESTVKTTYYRVLKLIRKTFNEGGERRD